MPEMKKIDPRLEKLAEAYGWEVRHDARVSAWGTDDSFAVYAKENVALAVLANGGYAVIKRSYNSDMYHTKDHVCGSFREFEAVVAKLKPRKYSPPDHDKIKKEFVKVMAKHGFVEGIATKKYGSDTYTQTRFVKGKLGCIIEKCLARVGKLDDQGFVGWGGEFKGSVEKLDTWLAEKEKPGLEGDAVSGMLLDAGFVLNLSDDLGCTDMQLQLDMVKLTANLTVLKDSGRTLTVTVQEYGFSKSYSVAELEANPEPAARELKNLTAWWTSVDKLYKEMKDFANRSGYMLSPVERYNVDSNQDLNLHVHYTSPGDEIYIGLGPDHSCYTGTVFAKETARMNELMDGLMAMYEAWKAPAGAIKNFPVKVGDAA